MTLFCNDPLKKGCTWSGDPEELVSSAAGENSDEFTHCPQCNGTSFEEEEDEDDEFYEEDEEFDEGGEA